MKRRILSNADSGLLIGMNFDAVVVFVTKFSLLFRLAVAILHNGAFCKFPFRWIYYYSSNESTGKETGKKHLCALVGCKLGIYTNIHLTFLIYLLVHFDKTTILEASNKLLALLVLSEL